MLSNEQDTQAADAGMRRTRLVLRPFQQHLYAHGAGTDPSSFAHSQQL